jgi:carboxyl-terminal processing protease
MKYKRILLFYIIFFMGAALAFGFGYLIRAIQDLSKESPFPILAQAYDILNNHAYEEVNDTSIIEYGMIRGMLDSYGDPFTRFEEPAQHEISTDRLEGKYGGIGAGLEYDTDGWIILHPFPEGPAGDAGILDGDRLVRVDNFEILPNTKMDDVVAALRGPEGEPVRLEVTRSPDPTIFNFRLIRKDLPLPSVTWHLENQNKWLGIIQVNLIAASTTEEVTRAFDDLYNRNATHFILDLRSNRGGLLTAGIDVARLFLENGIVLQEHYRGQDVKTYEVTNQGKFFEAPLAVIVNTETASSAEIVAASIDVHDRAPIIGTPTYGKDSIQLVFDLQDGSSIHVTAAKWWVPGLEYSIGTAGLQPDIIISDNEELFDPYIQAAIKYFQDQP